MKRSTIVEIISALFILLFVYTAVSKLMEGALFEYTLSKSPLIGAYSSVFAWALPATELLIGLLLFIPRTRMLGFYASTAIMTVFTLYLAYMIVFTSDLPCSCGGVLKQMTWKQHVVFNVIFTALGGWGIFLLRRNSHAETQKEISVRLKTKYSI